MPVAPAIITQVTITAKSINNDSVASVFTSVYQINIDYFKGVINIVDSIQGSFFFGLTLVTTFTVTINGSDTLVVIS